MTFTLVARCSRTGQHGVAGMTAMVGVGKLVSHARARIGAAASQAFMNPYLALDGLALLTEGVDAPIALKRLIDADPGREGRQFGLIDARGGSAAWTGSRPNDWKGHRTGEGWACQGNRLAGPQVVYRTVEAFLDHEKDDLIDRFLAALDAGEDAGGDTKGHHSATIFVMDTEQYPLWDLRIDHADNPLQALHEMKAIFEEKLIHQIRKLPTRANPMGGFDFGMTDGSV